MVSDDYMFVNNEEYTDYQSNGEGVWIDTSQIHVDGVLINTH